MNLLFADLVISLFWTWCCISPLSFLFSAYTTLALPLLASVSSSEKWGQNKTQNFIGILWNSSVVIFSSYLFSLSDLEQSHELVVLRKSYLAHPICNSILRLSIDQHYIWFSDFLNNVLFFLSFGNGSNLT